MSDIIEREFHCFSAESDADRAAKKKGLKPFIGYFEGCKSIADLGSGDGVFIELLKTHYPDKKIVGVELNDELIGLTKKKAENIDIVKDDVLAFVRRESASYDGYVLCDLIEHVDFEMNTAMLTLFPKGSIIFIKTPYTDSLLGHQFYLQVPSHKAPYSPTVIKKMLDRTGYRIIADGQCDGILYPSSLLGKIRHAILKLLFIDEYNRIFGGGNYFVVARKE